MFEKVRKFTYLLAI